jgi:hypothetical protein
MGLSMGLSVVPLSALGVRAGGFPGIAGLRLRRAILIGSTRILRARRPLAAVIETWELIASRPVRDIGFLVRHLYAFAA